MAEGEEGIELKFRIFDGTDIGHRTYPPSTTVATLKQRLVAEWPQGWQYATNYYYKILNYLRLLGPAYAECLEQLLDA